MSSTLSSSDRFRRRLTVDPPLLLDGPTGTELQHRGVNTNVPGWTAAAVESAADVLLAIHRDYVAAGAELLTANTFRMHPRNVAEVLPPGLRTMAPIRAAEWTRSAVQLARHAASDVTGDVWVAGSQAPLGDCYAAGQSLDDAALQQEHLVLSNQLALAGVDVILVETHPTLREALAASRAALSTGLPVITSLVCNPQGRLFSGESLAEAGIALGQLPLTAVGVNCILADAALSAVETLRDVCSHLPICVYANVGWMTSAGDWRNSTSTDPTRYAQHAARWLAAGARLIGSCCGTTPDHIRELRRIIADNRSNPSLESV
ncbi:MAG: homocysteine S-methyltransferase family protein [Planctomycetaceae bacterium]